MFALIHSSPYAILVGFLLSLVFCIQDKIIAVAVLNGIVALLSILLLVAVPREGRRLLPFSAKLFCGAATLTILAAITRNPSGVVTISAFAFAYSCGLVFGPNRSWGELWLRTFIVLGFIYAGGMVEFVSRNRPRVQLPDPASNAPPSLRLYPASAPTKDGYSENAFCSAKWQNSMGFALYKGPTVLLWRMRILKLEEERPQRTESVNMRGQPMEDANNRTDTE